MKLANTPENNAIVRALKKINLCYWVGNTIHSNIDKCLRAINNDSQNSGWYNPKAIRVKGLEGIFMLNENGSIFWEAKIVKVSNIEYKIEYLSNSGYREFESFYTTFNAHPSSL